MISFDDAISDVYNEIQKKQPTDDQKIMDDMIKDLNEIVMTVFADLNFINATLWKLEFDKIMLSHKKKYFNWKKKERYKINK